MRTPKVEVPKASKPIPVAQPDDPRLIDTQRRQRREADDREGSSGSLLTRGGASGDSSDSGTKKRRLGVGSLAY